MKVKNIYLVFVLIVALSLVASVAGSPTSKALGGTVANKIYLPFVSQQVPTVFGADATPLNYKSGVVQLSDAGTYWTRANDILWSSVESTQGVYDWSAAKEFERGLLMASTMNVKAIVNVKGIPAWAQMVTGKSCGPIKPDALANFGNFVNALVKRYSVPPYNVRYWEIMNEPDIDPALVMDNSLFGCWGNAADFWYGGGYFAEMLKVVYPQVKAADPSAQVFASGFVLDCGPTCDRAKFIEGIFANGGGNYMDAVSFHSYEYYGAAPGKFANPGWNSSWDKEGTAITTKAAFIRNLMAKYNVPNKPLYVTELALLCNPKWYTDKTLCVSSGFEETKAYYLARSIVDGIRNNIRSLIWYKTITAFGACGNLNDEWCYTGMINSDLSPRLTMNAYTASRREIAQGALVDSGQLLPGVLVYKFDRGNKSVWVLWSLAGDLRAADLGGTPLAIYDTFGNPIPTSSSIYVDNKPVYVEWAK